MPLKKRQFKISATTTQWGYLYTPVVNTYDVLSLLVHGHGVGEGGSTEAAVEAMKTQSPLALLGDNEDLVFVNPITGKRHGFAVLCLQAPNGWLGNKEVAYAVKNDLAEVPGAGANKSLHVMGLSAGGDFVMDFITDPATLPLVISAVPISPAGVGLTSNYPQLVSVGVKVWCHCGNADGGFTTNANSLVAGIIGVGGYARLNLWNGGHGGWVDIMRRTKVWPTWGRPNGGTNTSMSVWEFMMCAETATWTPAAEQSSDFAAVLDLPGAYKQADGTYLVNKAEQRLDATKSTNIVTTASDSFVWGVQTVVAGTWGYKWKDNGGSWGAGDRTLQALTNGTYQISVMVKSIKDPKKTTTVAVTIVVKIGATIPTEPIDPNPAPLTVQSIDFVGNRVLLSDGKYRGLLRADFDLKQKAYLLQTTFEDGDDTFTIPL